jgi:rod shape-determining protein MreD
VNPAKLAAVIGVTLLLQLGYVSTFDLHGARPDIMLLLAVAAGYVAGPERGALVGFAAGLSFDLFLSTPFGLSALVYCLVGYLVGAVGASMMRTSWWTASVVGGAGSAVGVVLYALVGEVLDQHTFQGPSLLSIVLVVTVVNAILAPIAFRAIRWSRRDEVDHRRHTLFSR